MTTTYTLDLNYNPATPEECDGLIPATEASVEAVYLQYVPGAQRANVVLAVTGVVVYRTTVVMGDARWAAALAELPDTGVANTANECVSELLGDLEAYVPADVYAHLLAAGEAGATLTAAVTYR